jgi:hypothetical protein
LAIFNQCNREERVVALIYHTSVNRSRDWFQINVYTSGSTWIPPTVEYTMNTANNLYSSSHTCVARSKLASYGC